MKSQGSLRRQTIKSVEFGKLIAINKLPDVRPYIKCRLSKVDVYTINYPVNQIIQFCHDSCTPTQVFSFCLTNITKASQKAASLSVTGYRG
jgi:hypothetical protein